MTDKSKYLFERLQAHAFAIAAWTAELSSPAAEAIRKYIIALADDHGRVMDLSAVEIARVDAEAGTADGQGLFQATSHTMTYAIEANLGPEKMLEIKRRINRAWAPMLPYDAAVEAAIDEYGGIIDALRAMVGKDDDDGMPASNTQH